MSYRIRLLETEEGWAVRVFQKLGYRVVRESGRSWSSGHHREALENRPERPRG